jgi:hypothetical protein
MFENIFSTILIDYFIFIFSILTKKYYQVAKGKFLQTRMMMLMMMRMRRKFIKIPERIMSKQEKTVQVKLELI